MSPKKLPFVLAILSVASNVWAAETEREDAGTKAPPATIQTADSSETPTPVAAVFHPFTGKVRRKNVRMRLKPDLDSPVVTELSRDELVLVDGEKDHFFSVVPPKEIKGYVFRSFVLDNVVEGSRVNVRLAPSLEAPVIGQLNSGDRVRGTMCAENAKWVEIDLPEATRFFVSKELVNHAGDAGLFASAQMRRAEVQRLLTETCLVSQSELRKPFEEIDHVGVVKNFSRIVDDYNDFSEQAHKAQEMLNLFEDAYFQKKLAFLESRAEQTCQAFAAKQAAFEAEVNTYQRKLTDIDRKLQKGSVAILEHLEEPQTSPEMEEAPTRTPSYHAMTDKMRVWEPIEESLYLSWLQDHQGDTMDEFYRDEELHATTLKGFVEPFSRPVKNRPGDYLLRTEQQVPVAYLYSTKVNLQDKIGQEVKVYAVARPNNHFAFPAYYVISVDE